jgi:Uri superfamily endonuclease
VKGSYILLIELPQGQTITVGSLKSMHFLRGYYAYVGSAMSGFKSRLSHHLKEGKRPHWHIDYLLSRASISSIILCETEERVECTIARALSHQFESIPDFGCSDCQCRSHLFFSTAEMKSIIMTTLNSLDMKPELVENSRAHPINFKLIQKAKASDS